jgi:hypothetical protein
MRDLLRCRKELLEYLAEAQKLNPLAREIAALKGAISVTELFIEEEEEEACAKRLGTQQALQSKLAA